MQVKVISKAMREYGVCGERIEECVEGMGKVCEGMEYISIVGMVEGMYRKRKQLYLGSDKNNDWRS